MVYLIANIVCIEVRSQVLLLVLEHMWCNDQYLGTTKQSIELISP